MKKFSIITLALVMIIALAACGRGNTDETSTPTTTSSDFNPTIIPDMDPTIETNIPDPNVDSTMPIYTDGTESTDTTGMTGGGNDSNGMGN